MSVSQVFSTGGATRVSIDLSGVATFAVPPECSVAPTTNNQLTNKSFVDSGLGGKVSSVSAGTNITVGGTAINPSVALNATLNNMTAINGANNTAISVSALGSGTMALTSATGAMTVGTTGAAALTLDTNNIDRITVAAGGGITVNPTSTTAGFVVNSNVNTAISVAGTTGITTFDVPPVCTIDPTGASQLTRKGYVDGLFTNYLTYNPVLSGGGTTLNSANYGTRVGRYIQIGNLVWFQIRLAITGKGGLSAGNIAITLPVSAITTSDLTQALSLGNITGMAVNIVSAFAQIPAGGSADFNLVSKTAASTGTANITTADIDTNFQIRVGGFYFA